MAICKLINCNSIMIEKSVCGKYLIILARDIKIYDLQKKIIVHRYKMTYPSFVYTCSAKSNRVLITNTVSEILVIDLSDFMFEKRISLKEKNFRCDDIQLCESSNPEIYYVKTNDIAYRKKVNAIAKHARIRQVNIVTGEIKLVYYIKNESICSLTYRNKTNEFIINEVAINFKKNQAKDCEINEGFKFISSDLKIANYNAYRDEFLKANVYESIIIKDDLKTEIDVPLLSQCGFKLKDFGMIKERGKFYSQSNQYLLAVYSKAVFVVAVDTWEVKAMIKLSHIEKTLHKSVKQYCVNDFYSVIFDDFIGKIYLSSSYGVYVLDLQINNSLQIFE